MRYAAIAILLLTLLLSACSGGGQPPGNGTGREVGSIAITPENASIGVNQSRTFTAVVRDTNNDPLNNVSLNWNSSNPTVATVTNGVATGLNQGTTEITASAASVTSNAATLSVTSSGNGDGAGDSIAYVSADSWDEIRLIKDDGTGDRLLWSHGMDDPGDLADPRGIYNVSSLAWRPDSSELAFASTHEMWCSLNTSDIFAIGASGGGYRRVTQAPACPALDDYPKGTVRIPLENPYGSQFETIIYFQGAPAAQEVSLPPNGSGVITFENVADLGNGVMQRAILINPGIGGQDREFGEEAVVDVQSGQTVQTPQLTLDYPNISRRLMMSPTWRHDGTKLGYVFLDNGLYSIDPQPAPLQQGELLATLYTADQVAYGPTPERSDQLLYVGEEGLESGIYLTSEGSAAAGELLVSKDYIYEDVLGLAWLPDGSGFVYSLKGPTPESEFITKANIYLYSFATEQVTPLTDFSSSEYAGRLSVSPDGQQLVFERATLWSALTGELVEPELWVMNRDGSEMRLLVENGRAPAWSP